MENRTDLSRKITLEKLNFHQKVEANLASKLGIPDLRAGNVTIRDSRNWKINEKKIEYCWLINISRSFVGWCWLFSIKFNESNFRGLQNQEELIQGIFTINNEGDIVRIHTETRTKIFDDKIRNIKIYDLFDANGGLTLDGAGYEYIIFALNTEIKISLNNPNSENWKVWENEIWRIGRDLAQKSGISELKEIFE